MFKVFGFFLRRLGAVAADGDGGWRAFVAFGFGHLGGEGGEFLEYVRRHGARKAGETLADDEVEGGFQAG